MSILHRPPPAVQSAFPFPEPDGPRPTAGPDFSPSAEDEAAHLGQSLVMAGEDPRPPEGWDFRRLVAFYGGATSAAQALAGEPADDFEAWLDGLPDPEPDWSAINPGFDPHDPCQRVEFPLTQPDHRL